MSKLPKPSYAYESNSFCSLFIFIRDLKHLLKVLSAGGSAEVVNNNKKIRKNLAMKIVATAFERPYPYQGYMANDNYLSGDSHVRGAWKARII